MCGIVGYASKYKLTNEKFWVSKALDSIKHRGPDDSGIWSSPEGKVEFGHRRLSINDLSVSGSQPMLDIDYQISIIFNGEIYNFKSLRKQLKNLGYVFKSRSDTEVIIFSYREWGENCVKKFEGMFVFALYDLKKKKLFIARDRAGEKPLFYYVDNNNILFSSEIKALTNYKKISKKINRTGLDCYLSFGFVVGSFSIFSDIKKLEPGSSIIFYTDTGEMLFKKYWSITNSRKKLLKFDNKKDILLNEFKFLFEDTISKQIEADVPVGVLLSGGLDSSLVTAISTRFTSKLKTFNVRFPEHKKFDETKHARLISKYFGTEHFELEADKITPDLLLKLATQFDEPIIDSSMLPTFLICQQVRKYCKVALGGDGADELFGGYSHYERLLKVHKFTKYIPFSLKKYVTKFISLLLHDDFRGQNWLQSFQYDYKTEVPLIANYFNSQRRKKLLGFDFMKENIKAEQMREKFQQKSGSLLERATKIDFLTYLTEDILVKVDRSSMLNSLEIRSPFLDHRIIDFAFSKIPDMMKVRGSNKKVFLQNYAKEILPSNFAFGRKQGFSIPINEHLKQKQFKNFVNDVLRSSDCIFNIKEINYILKSNTKGYNNGEKIFGLVMFELWRKIYKAEI